MTTAQRTTDRRRHEEFTDLLNQVLLLARKEHNLSRDQIAAFLTRGIDDPCAISKALLDKISEGAPRAKFPAHKLPLLCAVTGNLAPLHWLAKECHHLAIPMPRAEDDDAALLDTVEAQADVVKAYRAAVNRHSEGGAQITQAEANTVTQALDDLITAAAALKLHVQHQANRTSHQLAASM